MLLFFPLAYSQTAASVTVPELSFTGIRTSKLSLGAYYDRAEAVWTAQIAAAIMGFPFEHKTASVEWVDRFPEKITSAMVDDDWYYEMVALRAFQRYGIDLTVQELGRQWLENSAGTWGSSEQARLLMTRGIDAAEAGHPKYNKLWFSIGPQFSADVYGALAPGLPNIAAKMAREFGHINGYAEGVDGGVFIAGMVSLGFVEKDPKIIVRKAAKLIHEDSPYRKCLDRIIMLADQGKSPGEIINDVEDRWHIEYPATNNAVANGGIVAVCVWFGEGDFLKTVNLAFSAGDFVDADCNAANAASVIGAMKGMKAIPSALVTQLNDRIKGEKMGDVQLTPAVDESISGLARATATIGAQILKKNGVKEVGGSFLIPMKEVHTQAAELFRLDELTQYWNPGWKMERAGVGGAGGGMRGIRGNTYLDKEVLAAYPRDEVRGLLLHTTLKVNDERELSFKVGADAGRTWRLEVYANNTKLINKMISGGMEDRKWYRITADLSPYKGQTIKLRLYQRVLNPGKEAGNSYWKDIQIK